MNAPEQHASGKRRLRKLAMAGVLGVVSGALVFPLTGVAYRGRLADAEIPPAGIDAAHSGDYVGNPNSTPLTVPPDSDLSDPVLASGSAFPSNQLVANPGSPALYPPSIANVTSAWWIGTVGNWRTRVYAGSDASDQTQGVVIVHQESVDGLTVLDDQIIDTPQHDGQLQIVSAQGTLLNLTATDGSTYTFDVSTQVLTQTSSGGGCTTVSCP